MIIKEDYSWGGGNICDFIYISRSLGHAMHKVYD